MDIEKPKYLYKFCSAARAVQILRDQSLYLCPPVELNDMYEGSLQPLMRYSPEIAFNLRWRQIQFHTGWGEEEAKAFVREDDDPKEIKENFDQTIAHLKSRNLVLRRHSGITCFSARRDDQRMWGTYGDNHCGVCIEFYNYGKESLISRRCLPVLYWNELEDEDLTSVNAVISEDGTFNIGYFGMLCYLRKSLDWREEREWRVLMLADTPQDMDARKVPFESKDVRRVFLGPRITDSHAKEIDVHFSSKWSVLSLRSDPALGTTDLIGIEQVHSTEDLAYWVPAVRALMKKT